MQMPIDKQNSELIFFWAVQVTQVAIVALDLLSLSHKHTFDQQDGHQLLADKTTA